MLVNVSRNSEMGLAEPITFNNIADRITICGSAYSKDGVSNTRETATVVFRQVLSRWETHAGNCGHRPIYSSYETIQFMHVFANFSCFRDFLAIGRS